MDERPELPRWDILFHSYRLLIEHSGPVLRMAILPFLLLLALHRLTALVWPEGMAIVGWHVFYAVAYTVPMTLLLVPWYRLILSADRPSLSEPAVQGWYVSFLTRTLGLELMLTAFLMPSQIAGLLAQARGGDEQLEKIALFLFLATLAPGFYIYARAALALPAAAGEDDNSYRRSWRMTAAAGWRIAIIVLVIWITFQFIGVMLTGASDTPAPPPGILESALHAAIAILNELIIAAALALTYLQLGGTRGT